MFVRCYNVIYLHHYISLATLVITRGKKLVYSYQEIQEI